jgi:hypothetical protein
MSDQNRIFLVALNPDAESKLPYLLRLPLGDGVVLKARESWPMIARLLPPIGGSMAGGCRDHRADRVLLCRRRGAAIDLVLDRPRRARSQFVFTQVKGREAIFWQTQKAARGRQPGRPHPAPAGAPRPGHDRGRHEGALRIPLRPPSSGDDTGHRPRRRLRRARARRQRARRGRAQEPRELRRHALRRDACLPAATTRRAPVRRRCRGGPLLEALQARARRRQLARRPTRPTGGALPRSPPRLRRLPPLRRRVDLPLPHHSACRRRMSMSALSTDAARRGSAAPRRPARRTSALAAWRRTSV